MKNRKKTLGKFTYDFEFRKSSLKDFVIKKVIDTILIAASVCVGVAMGNYLYFM